MSQHHHFDSLLSSLEKHDEFKTSALGVSKQLFTAVAGTAVGGMIGGPLGALIGGVAGLTIPYFLTKVKIPIIDALRDLTSAQRKVVLGVVQARVGAKSVSSFLENPSQKKELLDLLRNTLVGLANKR